MNADLKEYISACSICCSHETSQQRETLMPHDVPNRPWAKVGTDLFSISDISYLIVWRRAVLIPIPKKGDLQQCSNYRTISLISHASKVMLIAENNYEENRKKTGG